jgi:hypothetical protein
MKTGKSESEDDAAAGEVYAKPELHHLKPVLQKHHFTLLKNWKNTKRIAETKETSIRNNSGSS